MKDNFVDGAVNREHVFKEFEKEDDKTIKFVYANIDNDYDSSAFILFRQNRKLYEINASHCSCYGYEGQWEPEECTYKELAARLTEHTPRLWNAEFCEYVKLKGKA